ncbi:DUF2207 domain-containing protein [Streptomyces yaanensis]|uniref:DUF2207 domain-containing protein n=1 Tax=Streptomyces yaanensis TaxID=1142239 RepID=A0ABV7S5C3_9ACTN|nr:DUF2207 domain-containing protein [Streptomyces sp. CGMCC 4.7035]WNC00702.1 DUF2207 domain-containing protein [Streptomyces sp. CGMCC 4.7035]
MLAGAVAVARAGANTERVTTMWVGARIAADGSARITEVIDYDFGHDGTTKHGIYRDLPDLPYDEEAAEVAVTLDGARVPWELTTGDYYLEPNGHREIATRIKVGDPGRSVNGLHRYRVQYTLQGVVRKGRLAWNAVGTGWRIDRSRVEIHVVAPYALTGPRCVHGTDGSHKSCTVESAGPGQLTVTLDRLKGKEGLTLYASRGQGSTGQAALPAPPTGTAVGTSLTYPGRVALSAAGLALAAAALTIGLLRFVGRDPAAPEGADGTPATDGSSPTPPQGLGPAQGGILLAERVEPQHQVAWLLGAAADGHLTISGTDRAPTLRRRTNGAGPADPVTREVLRYIFAGRGQVTLGGYDSSFRTGWQALTRHLEEWRDDSGLWDPAAVRRARAARPTGIVATLLGLVTTVVGAVLGGGRHPAGEPVLVVGAIVFGAGLALWLRSWELNRRTPEGSAQRLRTEAFRRYLADPSAFPDQEPLDDDQVRLYTAWAAAFGLGSRWRQALEASAVATRYRSSPAVRFGPAQAVGLLYAARVSHTAPSSSSSSGSSSSGSFGGGGSDGGVGGGAGGGGGGSW